MQYLMACDVFSIVLLAVIIIGILNKQNRQRSYNALGLASITTMVCCFAEIAVEYIGKHGASNSLIFSLVLFRYAFIMIVQMAFTLFWFEFINEKSKLKQKTILIPIIVDAFGFIYVIIHGLLGKIFVVNNGVYTVTGGMPFFAIIILVAIVIYSPIVAIVKRKDLKFKHILMISILGVIPISATILNAVLGSTNYTLPSCAFSLFIQYVLTENEYSSQRDMIQAKELEDKNDKLRIQLEEITKLNMDLEKQMNIVQSISNIFYASYYIDLLTGDYTELSTLDKIRDVIGGSGKNAQETLNQMSEKLIHPDYSHRMKEFVQLDQIKDKLKEKNYITFEYIGRFSGWSQAYFICGERDENNTPTKLFYVTRQIADEKAREEESKSIIESLSREYHTVWITDKESRDMRLMRSSGVSTIKGAVDYSLKVVSYDIALKQYISQYVEPEDRERLQVELSFEYVVKMVEEYGTHSVNYSRRDENNRVGYHQITFFNADTSNARKQFVFGFRDIDAIVKEDQRNRQLLKEAKENAEAANNAKTSFLNNMSHDIRTPLNAIMGYASLMEKQKDNPEIVSDYLRKISTSGEYLLTIINNVLDMARIESGNAEINEEFMDLLGEDYNPLGVFEPLIKSKNITFSGKQDIKHRYVFADITKVHQITVNLVSNALKYTPNGGTVSADMWEVPCEIEGYATIVLQVSDSGIGMSEEYQKHIFDSFSREQNTTQSKVIGTGLGMSIVKKLVDIMGGTIEVYSKKGEGTKFTVTLTHRIVEEPEKYLVNKEENIEFNLEEMRGMRLLVAEDNELNAEIVSDILEEQGFVVELASDGAQCFDIYNKSDAGYYDLILMDIQMPVVDGYEATRMIRGIPDKDKASIPILAVTANAFESDIRLAAECGMNGHLSKPINIEELQKEIIKILKAK